MQLKKQDIIELHAFTITNRIVVHFKMENEDEYKQIINIKESENIADVLSNYFKELL